MLLDFGLVRVLFRRLLKRGDCVIDLAALELGPAERILIEASSGANWLALRIIASAESMSSPRSSFA